MLYAGYLSRIYYLWMIQALFLNVMRALVEISTVLAGGAPHAQEQVLTWRDRLLRCTFNVRSAYVCARAAVA